MKEFKFILPVEVKLGKTERSKAKFILNLNNYRNAFHNQKNEAKIKFKEVIGDQLASCPAFENPIEVEYKWFPGRAGRSDMDNVVSIVKKFFQDSLTEAGVIPDDDGSFLLRNIEAVGHVDSDFPRVEAIVRELPPEWVRVNSMASQLDRFEESKFEDFLQEIREDGEGFIEHKIFKKFVDIKRLTKKEISGFIFDNFGFRSFDFKREGNFIFFSNFK